MYILYKLSLKLCIWPNINTEEIFQTKQRKEPVEGEHEEASGTSQDKDSDNENESPEDTDTNSADSNSDHSKSDKSNTGGVSETAEEQQNDQERMDLGREFSNTRSHLPSARKWTQVHTPDLIIGIHMLVLKPEEQQQMNVYIMHSCQR